jgi:hypothetical protein
MTTALTNEAFNVFGGLKSATITHANPREWNPSATDLPTSKPATPQVSITVQQSDLPTFAGNQPISYKKIPAVNVSGQNNTGSAVTVNYEIHKNGATIASGSKTSIANTNYWSIDTICGACAVGDLIEVFLWASASPSCNFSYYSIFVYSSSVQMTKDKTICKNLSFSTQRGVRNYALLVSTNYNAGGLVNYQFVVSPSSGGLTVNLVGSFTWTIYFQDSATQFFGGINAPDSTVSVNTFTSTTKLVNYQGMSFLTSISFREMLR